MVFSTAVISRINFIGGGWVGGKPKAGQSMIHNKTKAALFSQWGTETATVNLAGPDSHWQ